MQAENNTSAARETKNSSIGLCLICYYIYLVILIRQFYSLSIIVCVIILVLRARTRLRFGSDRIT